MWFRAHHITLARRCQDSPETLEYVLPALTELRDVEVKLRAVLQARGLTRQITWKDMMSTAPAILSSLETGKGGHAGRMASVSAFSGLVRLHLAGCPCRRRPLHVPRSPAPSHTSFPTVDAE